MELYKKHRPSSLDEVVGQSAAVATLQQMADQKSFPHTLLFTGASGCGKTTLARIVKELLGCSDNDFVEMNCADFNGINMIRDIRTRMGLAPIGGKCRIWLIDEAHQLSSQAQNAFLKMLEDTPSHVYFLLATTDPNKLLKTVKTRCTEVKVKELAHGEAEKLLKAVCKREKRKIDEEVRDKIIEMAEGSARKLLVLLDQVMGLKDAEEQLAALEAGDYKAQAIALARELMNPRTSWTEVAKVLRGIEEDPESIRHMVLGYANAILTKGGKLSSRAYCVIEAFRDNFYDSKKAGLTAACYEVVVGVD